MIAVIPGNFRQYEDFIRWLSPLDRHKFHRVMREDDIIGRCFTKIISIGTYWELKNYDILIKLCTYNLLKNKVERIEFDDSI